MVTVHQLFSKELPDPPQDVDAHAFAPRGEGGCSGNYDEASVLASLLSRSQRRHSSPKNQGPLERIRAPRPNLGPSPDVMAFTTEELEEKFEAVKEAQMTVARHYRDALRRKKANAFSRASTATPSSGRYWLESSCTNRSSDWGEEVPAVFPFPEPIPVEIPSRRPASQQSRRSATPVQYGGSISSRPSSRAEGFGGRTSPFSARGNSPSPGPSRPTSRAGAASPDVPAVFPFPEPIPHEVPSRSRSIQPAESAVDEESITGASKSRQLDAWASEGERLKQEVTKSSFLIQNRKKADSWIRETAPQGVFLPYNKRAVWLVMKQEDDTKRKNRNQAMRTMPTLPFDLWCTMKEEEAGAARYGEVESADAKLERKLRYQRLGAERRDRRRGRDSPSEPSSNRRGSGRTSNVKRR
eukprot:TRINITY_DN11290_c0_g1_i1.p1 TRINITY_DN11290_c0_g1~~TRINITY_DN11290_c0_g1_i1.p1  ORF type:complete len:412 (+),score=71.81 TRINITY_DN11290_c0_g1_i1:66-1301(+)